MSRVGADSSEGCGCRTAFKVNTNRALCALIHKTHLETSRVADSIKVQNVPKQKAGGAQIFPTRTLLVADGSREATLAAEAAVELVNGTGSELHVVHVISTVQEMPYPRRFAKERTEAFLEAKKLHALTLLDRRVAWIEKIGGKVAGSHYREGKPDEEVIRLSEELDVGLVITGDRRLGWFERALARSFSERVLSRANRPVLVVREPVSRKRMALDLR